MNVVRTMSDEALQAVVASVSAAIPGLRACFTPLFKQKQEQPCRSRTLAPAVKWVDLSASEVPSHGSACNAELFKQLSPQWVGILKAVLPQTA